MPPAPVPADPGWDDDLTWLDRDPMTAEEFEASLDRLCELDEPPGEEDYGEIVLCAWDRMEAHAHARKLAAVAELARRNPVELDAEFTADQVACALGESRARADSLIGMAQTLPTHLPGTAAALEDGTISRYKEEIIGRATALLDEDEARAAEAEVLDRAAQLTSGALRAAIARLTCASNPSRHRRRTGWPARAR
jgi:hypothetical protein